MPFWNKYPFYLQMVFIISTNNRLDLINHSFLSFINLAELMSVKGWCNELLYACLCMADLKPQMIGWRYHHKEIKHAFSLGETSWTIKRLETWNENECVVSQWNSKLRNMTHVIWHTDDLNKWEIKNVFTNVMFMPREQYYIIQ